MRVPVLLHWKIRFNGKWLVFWGGETAELSGHHHTDPGQRYAFDFLVPGENGLTYRNHGLENQDYYAFGKEVLAPADGVVRTVIRGVSDNRPNSMNPYSGVGNATIIEHAKDVFSLIAHYKLGSIQVEVGDAVTADQVLGLCGNSGNSSEPHIHFHLMHSGVMQAGKAVKCVFSNVRRHRDGESETLRLYSPIKGDVVEPE